MQADAARAAVLRYKRPALSSMEFYEMRSELRRIVDDNGELMVWLPGSMRIAESREW